jgi:2-succinyl-5-enolpyruvyl-6-hydroxy-3-cyclohexene-1-carboxylate synthase
MLPPAMNSHLAQTTLLHLARLGVREVCLAAGARNVPLITAFMASSGLRLWNFFEERCAGFFALGRMLATGQPVAVLTTSGTATAELLPAVIEAHYQGLPLVVITADRPSHFRGSGAPQAIEQLGLYGAYAEKTLDIEGTAEPAWPATLGRRPLHVNVCLDEPLVGEVQGIDFSAWDDLTKPMYQLARLDAGHRAVLESFLQTRDGLFIMVGGLSPQDAQWIKPVLLALQLPIMAEATAQLHSDADLAPWLIRGGDSALKTLGFTRVIRIGGVPSWRWWRDLETRPDIRALHFSHNAFPGLGRGESLSPMPLHWLKELPLLMPDQEPLSLHTPNSHFLHKLHRCMEAHPLSEVSWMQHLAKEVSPGASIFLGNSLPIREWNLSVAALSEGCTVWANRGSNGIDGLLSTALGTAVNAAESWTILGDLSALYDLAGLWPMAQMKKARHRIVIVNNAGGKIFSRVESLRSLPALARSMVENRHPLQFSGWAQMWGLPYRLAKTPQDLLHLPDEPVIVEVQPDAAETDGFWQEWSAA